MCVCVRTVYPEDVPLLIGRFEEEVVCGARSTSTYCFVWDEQVEIMHFTVRPEGLLLRLYLANRERRDRQENSGSSK